jgi:type II secretory pathway pseudopilin PulG
LPFLLSHLFTRLKAVSAKKWLMRSKSGLTLIELLLSIGIIWALAGLSAPFLSTFLGSERVDITTDKVIRTLRKAQSYALAGKENSTWGVHYETGNLVLFKGSSYLGRDSSFDEEFSTPRAITISGLNDIHFNKLWGNPSQTISVTVSTPYDSETITVNLGGLVDTQ